MRLVLLGLAAPLAAILVPAVPAAAQSLRAAGFTAGPAFAASPHGVTVHRNSPGRVHGDFRLGDGDGHDDDDDRDRPRRHRRGDFVFIYDRDWQGDTAWRADSYNDWWHERPWRSYPRWVRSNRDCERIWQGGGVWRCEW